MKKTAAQKFEEILTKNRSIKNILSSQENIKIIKRAIKSYNDKVSKESRISFKVLSDISTKKELRKVYSRITGKKRVISEKEKEKREKAKKQREIKRNRILGYQKFALENYGLKLTLTQSKKIGDIFKILRDQMVLPGYLTSEEVVIATNTGDINKMLYNLENIKDVESRHFINDIFGREVLEIEEEVVERDDSLELEAIFGGR